MSKRSERKRQEEEARRRQEMMRRQMMMQQQYGYGMQQPLMMNNMNYGPMNGANAPGRFIQLTPIIQPIAMVPYATQSQPMMSYGDDGMGGYDGYPGEDEFF